MDWTRAILIVLAFTIFVVAIVNAYYTLRVRRDVAMYDLITKCEELAEYMRLKHEDAPLPPEQLDNLAWIRRQARTPPMPAKETKLEQTIRRRKEVRNALEMQWRDMNREV